MKYGFTCGAFDLLHPGHIHLLSEARTMCDVLLVGLHTDPTIDRPEKNKPVQSTFERYAQLAVVEGIDHIIPYDTENDLLNLLATFPINVRFLGSDYEHRVYTGSAVCEKRDIEIVFIPRLHNWSSSELRGRLSK
jgi:glycerol-3-phosphate cytidylyltransferase